MHEPSEVATSGDGCANPLGVDNAIAVGRVMRIQVVSCMFVLMLTSCAEKPKPTLTKFELTAEQKIRRQKLLKDALDPNKLAKQASFDVDEFVGRDVTDYSELIRLADTVRETEAGKTYAFSLEGVSKNQEGWGTLGIRVANGRITNAGVFYGTW